LCHAGAGQKEETGRIHIHHPPTTTDRQAPRIAWLGSADVGGSIFWIQTLIMTIMTHSNNGVAMMVPKELVYWVIELLGADPAWWLLQPPKREEGSVHLIRKETFISSPLKYYKN